MECPQCGKNEAFWIRGTDISVYRCDACGHEFEVDVDRAGTATKSAPAEHAMGRTMWYSATIQSDARSK